MKTAVDSSVLLDVFAAGREHGEHSRVALRRAYDAGALVACDVVWAEVRAHFPEDAAFHQALSLLGVRFEPLDGGAAATAGVRWRRYCLDVPRRDRDRVVADFLIGAHAMQQADQLLSRDRGFFTQYFADLHLLDPSRG